MKTEIALPLRETPLVEEADRILRSCVHCGFCTATCPTYQVTGDELDGPRGRIYLIKAALEDEVVTRETQRHLDRCLDCRACETTCPSGVRYSRLLDIGRAVVNGQVTRPLGERFKHRMLRAVVPHRRRFGGLLRVARGLRPLLPRALAAKVPNRRTAGGAPTERHHRQMLLLESCGQAGAAPDTNAAAARILDRLEIEVIRSPRAGCCGALSRHLDAPEEARRFARNNIDAWWPLIEGGTEAVLISASGCGTMVKEYGELLADDPRYRERARRIAGLARDLSEVVAAEADDRLRLRGRGRVAFHAPCSLQHGQGIVGAVERLLTEAGYQIVPVSEPHLCCGSAGPYSLLQRDLADTLLKRKLTALQRGEPELIATANIGCQLHLQSGTPLPVCHWIELIDRAAY